MIVGCVDPKMEPTGWPETPFGNYHSTPLKTQKSAHLHRLSSSPRLHGEEAYRNQWHAFNCVSFAHVELPKVGNTRVRGVVICVLAVGGMSSVRVNANMRFALFFDTCVKGDTHI
jgi:hypothetical protein